MTADGNGRPLVRRAPSVVVVGAGVSGLCMAVKLKEAGVEDLTILEKAADLGGTWRENTYPGLVCDIPSRIYSYSFAPNPHWSRPYSPGPEIHGYLERVARNYGILDHIRFGKEVEQARWEDGRWTVRTAEGDEMRADFLISACGFLHRWNMPDIPGLETFEGPKFHSAEWDHDAPLSGRRVGVVGTGSSGVQIVGEVANRARKLTHFQRTPQWILPTLDRNYSRLTRFLMRRFPALNRLSYRVWLSAFETTYGAAFVEPGLRRKIVQGICRLHLRTVRDPELRRKLTPDYEPLCKRIVVSTRFYPAVERPNVEVVTEGIERVEPGGVVTEDGRRHELDVLVLATGFDAHAYVRPMDLVGENGHTLAEAWSGEPWAYRTVALPGFPNFFMLMGPHSPVANASIFFVAETQVAYVMKWIRLWQEGRVSSMVPRLEPTERYHREMDEAMPRTAWVSGCTSWYMGADGKPAVFPWSGSAHREMLSELRMEEFEVRPGPAVAVAAPDSDAEPPTPGPDSDRESPASDANADSWRSGAGGRAPGTELAGLATAVAEALIVAS